MSNDKDKKEKDDKGAVVSSTGKTKLEGQIDGVIKWFSQERLRFIHALGVDYYVHVTDIQGTSLPSNGDTVTFTAAQGDKGLKAERVNILKRANAPSGFSSNSITSHIVKAHFTIWGFKALVGLVGALLFRLYSADYILFYEQ